jgi:S-formylglutathione hydrolase
MTDTHHSNPSKTPWGTKAFKGYLSSPGPSDSSNPPDEWLQYDSTHLLANSKADKGSLHILVDVGTADDFLGKGQLEPDVFEKAAKEAGREGEVEVRMQEGFDHSYYFVGPILGFFWVEKLMFWNARQISTFSPEHVEYHAKYLKQ